MLAAQLGRVVVEVAADVLAQLRRTVRDGLDELMLVVFLDEERAEECRRRRPLTALLEGVALGRAIGKWAVGGMQFGELLAAVAAHRTDDPQHLVAQPRLARCRDSQTIVDHAVATPGEQHLRGALAKALVEFGEEPTAATHAARALGAGRLMLALAEQIR